MFIELKKLYPQNTPLLCAVEDISSVVEDNDCTIVIMKNGYRFEVLDTYSSIVERLKYCMGLFEDDLKWKRLKIVFWLV